MNPFKPVERRPVEIPLPLSQPRRLSGDWFFQKKSAAETLPHLLFTPLHYERGYAYPLLVWLHGPGTDERQLMRIMPQISCRNYVAIGVRGILRENEADRKSSDRNQEKLRYDWPANAESIAEAAERVFRAIELASHKRHVHPGRIFLAGSRSGGTMAFRIALQQPSSFAGVISLGGPLPRGEPLLRRFSDLRHLEVLIAVARESPSYPSPLVCENLRLLHGAGLSGIMLREYPAGWHLSLSMLRDVDRWLMERITQGVSSPHP